MVCNLCNQVIKDILLGITYLSYYKSECIKCDNAKLVCFLCASNTKIGNDMVNDGHVCEGCKRNNKLNQIGI